MSVPLTSGVREIALMRELNVTSGELRRSHHRYWRANVLERNILDARKFAEQLRSASAAHLVVDPSRLDVDGWDQSDYNTLWINLMKTYATRLVAAPGWEYSKGARG